MREMIQDRRDAKAQGVERADVFTNLLNASEMERGEGGKALSDRELTGGWHLFSKSLWLYTHWRLSWQGIS